MTFHGLAEKILRQSDKPLTANEIWALAVEQGLTEALNSTGKTPSATLAARLYVISRDNPDGIFQTVGKRPKRFYLKGKKYEVDFEVYETGQKEDEEIIVSTSNFKERDLHAFLAHFARYGLNCYTKTINHSTSKKASFGEWVHPDMVGCVFPEWDNEVLQLSKSVGNTSIQLMSFELKKQINLSKLREYFFQTVSNSSWANESYLVAADISDNADFRSELARLSTSFGIGIIQLDVENPNDSKVLFPAKNKENLDWETINKLTMNKDFKQFLKRIQIDVNSNMIHKENYDKILEEKQLAKLIKQ